MAPNLVPCVFVVDDEPVIASTLAAILKLNGYCATSFTSPIEALATAQSRTPDLLISDVVMPGLSGIDLAIQLSVDAPECKILLFSGQTCNADLLKIARIQGHDFELLEKPVHPLEILSRVAALTAEIDSIRRCPYVTGDPAKQAIPDCGRWNRLSTSARED